MKMEYSIVQPTPGWGVLCEQCRSRFRSPQHYIFPCHEIPDCRLERLSIDGHEVLLGELQHRDYLEWCSKYCPMG